jgi:hypothetical protein
MGGSTHPRGSVTSRPSKVASSARRRGEFWRVGDRRRGPLPQPFNDHQKRWLVARNDLPGVFAGGKPDAFHCDGRDEVARVSAFRQADRNSRWLMARGLVAIVLLDVFAQRAIDASLVPFVPLRVAAKPIDQICVEPQGDLPLDRPEKYPASGSAPTLSAQLSPTSCFASPRRQACSALISARSSAMAKC